MTSPPRAQSRSVALCEAYLDRLAVLMHGAGKGADHLLPIAKRLMHELEEARVEEELRAGLAERFQQIKLAQEHRLRDEAADEQSWVSNSHE